MRFLIKTACTAFALWIVTLLPLDVAVTGDQTGWSRVLVFLAVGAVIAGLNAVVKPILKVLSIPVLILTLGLFSLIITWFILWLAAWITSSFSFASLTIGGFWKSLLAALIIAIITAITNAIVPKPRRALAR